MKTHTSGYAVSDRLRVSIERIVPGGAGLARGPLGVVLVEASAPGDLVEIEINSLWRSRARCRVDLIRRRSHSGRAALPMVRNLRRMRFAAYLLQSAGRGWEIVRDALERIAGVDCGRYRSDRFRRSGTSVHVLASNSIPVRRAGQWDFLLGARSRSSMSAVHGLPASIAGGDHRPKSGSRSHHDQRRLVLCSMFPGLLRADFAQSTADGRWVVLAHHRFTGLLRASGRILSGVARSRSSHDRARASSSTRERGLAWDLFSGIGLFALPLAQDYRQVVGVEFDGRSASNAVRGAERNEIANVRFASADVNEWLGHKRHRHVVPDLVVVDPPRVGLGTGLRDALARSPTPQA